MIYYDESGKKLVDPGIEDRLEDEFYELIEKRKEYARQWENSEIPARSVLMNSIIEIHIRIKNIFKKLLENDFTLSERMQNYKEYGFSKDLKDDIIFYPENVAGTAQSKLENKNKPLSYKEVEPLLIKLKKNDPNLNDIDKNMMKLNSFKAQRSKFMKNNRMYKNFKSILEALFDNECKRIPLGVFYQLLASPSNYYNRVLLNSFTKLCNVSNGEYYERCKKYKVEEFKARNPYKEEIEMHVGLILRNTN